MKLKQLKRFARIYLMPVVLVLLFLLSQDEGEISKMWEYFFYYIGGFYVLVVLVGDLDPQYFGFIKTYVRVHAFKHHLQPKYKSSFLQMNERIREQLKLREIERNVWQKLKLKWEISLMEKIKEESGWFTQKYTGKHKNKLRMKFRIHGQKLKNT